MNRNLQTALLLAVLALTTFFGIIAKNIGTITLSYSFCQIPGREAGKK